MYQILSYVTFNTDERPFPFADFPADGTMTAKIATKSSKKKTAKKKTASKKIEDKGDDENKGDA